MRRISVLLMFLSVVCVCVAPAAEPLSLVRPARAPLDADGSLRIELDPVAYRLLWDGEAGRIADFPLPDGRRVDLELTSFPLIAPEARFVDVGPHGQRELRSPDVKFFRGTVAGESGSRVVLSLFQGRIAGSIHTDGSVFGFGPRSLSLARVDATELTVWDRVTERGEAICEAPGEPVHIDATSPGRSAPLATLGGPGAELALDLAVESTTEWCAHFGNDVSAAQLYLLNVVAGISAIYEAEVSILVRVAFLRTFCGAADPYPDGLTSLNDRSALLMALENEWRANMDSVQRTVAHLYTFSNSSSAGGLARTIVCSGQGCQAVLCNDDSGYGVNMLPAAGGSPATFEIRVAAHELGHNHSSPHTNCLQNDSGQWLSTCAIESCGSNPWCQSTGCYPGPVNMNMTGTVMSTACNSRSGQFDDDTEGPIIRGAAEAASCVGSAGLPGEVPDTTAAGLRLTKVAACPSATLRNDDGALNTAWGACSGCQYAWIKRFTPSCYPFRIDTLQVMTSSVAVGRPIRLLVYADPAGTGNPANATLVYTQDVTVQVVGPASFNSYTLAAPVTITSGQVYLGVYDLQVSSPAPFIASMDTSTSGDSYNAVNSTDPGAFSLRSEGTWLIRGSGGAVAAGTVELTWGPPCNDATTTGQDFGVYRGALGAFTTYASLTCSTGGSRSYVTQTAPNNSFFLVVPHTTASEGSYGQSTLGERPPATVACEPQDFEACP